MMCSVMIVIVAYGDGIGTQTYIGLTAAMALGIETTFTAIQGVRFCSEIEVIYITKLFGFSQGNIFIHPVVTPDISFCSRSAFINGYIFSIFHSWQRENALRIRVTSNRL